MSDTTNRIRRRRCKICGQFNTFSATNCSNPVCGVDLALYSEIVFEDAPTPPPPPPPPKPKGWLIGLAAVLVIALLLFALPSFGGDDDTQLRQPDASAISQTQPTDTEPITTETPTTSQPQTEPPSTEPVRSWQDNVLMTDIISGYAFVIDIQENATVLGHSLKRTEIASITFLDSIANAAANQWDVSALGDGSVIAWVEKNGELYDLFIAGEGGVCAPNNCEDLFAHYENVREINFNGCFHTENVTNMTAMFYFDKSLTELDLGDFDTSNVIDMSFMFGSCDALTALSINSFNTSNVTDMSYMFAWCEQLKALDISSFNTANVTTMNDMFYNCEKLTSLDLSSFDTSKVQDMKAMFSSCSSLRQLDISNFNTSHVMNMKRMFAGCPALEELELGSFDTSIVIEYEDFMDGDYLPDGRPWKELFD